MSPAERVVAHLAILGVICGSIAAIASRTELFPFSNYPMYSHVSRVPYALGKLVGVAHEGSGEHEIPLDQSAQLFPFSERTLRSAVSRILREDGPEAAARALGDELALYNARLAEHGGRPLDAIRYYEMSLVPDGIGSLVARHGRLLAESARQ